MKKIAVLGSTGSIGTQTLDVVRNNKDIEVPALAAGSNVKALADQIREFRPKLVCIAHEKSISELRLLTGDLNYEICCGMEGLIRVATYDVDIVVTAIVGMIGIIPTIEAIKAGRNIALANKETLVTAGHIIMPLAARHNVRILPVDSEHSAVFQSLNGEKHTAVEKILLTASGGPFRGRTIDEMRNVKLEDALKHPNWNMGRKITIDSATMVNKGLEVMEARWLFGVEMEDIRVIVQPQSVIHSMVQFIDGSIIAQLGCPDMRLPIQYALYYPDRKPMNSERLDFAKLGSITFEEPDMVNFRGLAMAYEAGTKGGNLPTVFNAANEFAVDKFLKKECGFLEITDMIEKAMGCIQYIDNPDVAQILDTEKAVYELLR